MKKSIWAFVLVVPGVLLLSIQPARAGHPCCAGFGGGCLCLGMFSGIHRHGPLYCYGPNCGGDCGAGHGESGMPWKNGCGLLGCGKLFGGCGLFHGCGGCDDGGCGLKGKLFGHCRKGCDAGCDTGCEGGIVGGSNPIQGSIAPAPVTPAPASAAYPQGYPSHAQGMPAYGSYAYGSNPQANFGGPAYGSVTAQGYAPTPAYAAPRPAVMPVSYGSYWTAH